jgi:hypothetical protein
MMGMSPNNFWQCSPQEIYLSISGFKEFHAVDKNEPMTRNELNDLMELYPDG